MTQDSIHYWLDFAVKLLDTTTGYPVSQESAHFAIDGHTVQLSERLAGVYILCNQEEPAALRQDIELLVAVKGYLEYKARIRHEELPKRCPVFAIPLIPEIPRYGYSDIYTLSGVMEGMEDIEAVSLHAPLAKTVSYNKKKQILRLYDAAALEEERYALLHEEQNFYEPIWIADRKNKLLLTLAEPLKEELQMQNSIARIVKGRVETGGRYLLRVRADAFGTAYLVRYTVNGKDGFRRIVFADSKEREVKSWE